MMPLTNLLSSVQGDRHSDQLLVLLQAAGAIITLEVDHAGMICKGSEALFRLLGISDGSPQLRQWVFKEDREAFDSLLDTAINTDTSPIEKVRLSAGKAGGIARLPCDVLAYGTGNPRSGARIMVMPPSHATDPSFQLVHHKLLNLGTLSAGIAHDMTNLFTGILAFVDILNSQILDPNHKRYLQLIQNSIQTGMELTHAVTSLLKDDQGKPEPIDPIACIRQLVRLVRPSLRPGVQLITHMPSQSYPLVIRRSFLQQLLLNLILNARDAIEGQGKILVQTYFSPLTGPKELIITVRDSGKGLQPEQIEQIFTPLYTTKSGSSSTGMGLTIVKTLVDQQGGTIEVSSEPGRYTLFTIRLPLDEPSI